MCIGAGRRKAHAAQYVEVIKTQSNKFVKLLRSMKYFTQKLAQV
jgi:hypothetical protein